MLRASGLTFLIAAACLQAAPPQKQPQASAVIRSETRVVLVDAVVTDKKGAYVHDLSAKDFRVWEDNKEQTIQSFVLESAKPAPGAEAHTTYVALLFDYAAMDAGDQILARQAGAKFIDANTGPDRLMAVATFDNGFRIEQGFTANAGRLKDVLTGAKASTVSTNNASTGTSAGADLSGRDKFRSLERLAAELASVPGRKAIVLFTGSLTVANDQKAALNAAIEACNKSNVAIYPIDVRDMSIPGAFSAENPSAGGRGGRGGGGGGRVGGGGGGRLRGDEDTGQQADPGGVSQQAIFALASGTGGFVIRNASELPSGLQKIGEEQGEYYVLGYTPPEEKEGSCHALRVKVDRSGTTVRARSNYCTGKGQDLITGASTGKNSAEKSLEKSLENHAASAQAGNIAASIALPFFYVGPNTARVNLAMEISPEAVNFERKKDTFHADINVLGIATSQASPSQGDNSTGARFSDTLTLDLDAEQLQQWKQKPLHYEKEFKIASGQYSFTIVFSAGGESFGKLERPLAVEPYQPGQLALSAIALGKEIHKTADVSAALFEDRAGLVTGDLQVTPTGSSVFAKAGPAYCYFEVYPLEAANPGLIGVRIFDAKTGELKSDGGSMKMMPAPAGKSTIPIGLNIPVASLESGSYRLEIMATDEGGKSVMRTADFDVK